MAERAIKSAERVLALFELFSWHEGGLKVGQVSRELNIPQPSASMLLLSLRRLGYVDYDRNARLYTPTIRVMLLGSWISRKFNQAGSMAAHLTALKQRCQGETTFAAFQNGAAVQYVLTMEADMPERLNVASGALVSLLASASGRVLLSLKQDSEVVGWVRRANAEAPEPRLRYQERAFLTMMDAVRAQGYATTMGDSRAGMGAVAVAITSPLGDMPLAVGVGGPLARVMPARQATIEALRQFQQEFGSARDTARLRD